MGVFVAVVVPGGARAGFRRRSLSARSALSLFVGLRSLSVRRRCLRVRVLGRVRPVGERVCVRARERVCRTRAQARDDQRRGGTVAEMDVLCDELELVMMVVTAPRPAAPTALYTLIRHYIGIQ